MHDEDEEVEAGFKISDDDDPDMELPEGMEDLEIDDDPEDRYH
jgi:hypothetical protein